jgi:chaperonin GroEL
VNQPRRGKLVAHHQQARRSLLSGIDMIADLVQPTLGPRGSHVVIQRHEAPPLVTNDGVTIARSIEVLQDPLRNQGVQLLREVAATAEDFLGDGTTTAVLLTRAMVHDAFRRIEAGALPHAISDGIEEGVKEATDWIRAQARPVHDSSDVAAVATVASRDPRIGRLVADALERVGHDGLVRIQDDRAYGVTLEFRDGMRFDNGVLSGDLITDLEAGNTRFNDCRVLVANERITQVAQLVPALDAVTRARQPLLIVADEVSGDALTLIVLNVGKRRLPAIAVKAPLFGPDRTEALRDIASFTGGTVLGAGVGRPVRGAKLEHLGTADEVVADHEETTILGGAGRAGEVAARLREIDAGLGLTESDYEREKLRLRHAWLGGSVASIKVGLDSETEQEETRMRIQDAVNAGRAALTEGLVPGGGATLLRAADQIPDGPGPECEGRAVIRAALEAPLRQLCRNAGIDPGNAVEDVRRLPPGFGLDVATGRSTDLDAAGILDPAKVLVAALDIASSVARTCLRADVVIAQWPLPRRRTRGHGHHHGHEGEHDHGHSHANENGDGHAHSHPHDAGDEEHFQPLASEAAIG